MRIIDVQHIRHWMLSLAVILPATGTRAAADGEAAVPILEREIEEIYLEAGWLTDRLPELYAQLEIAGGIDFGRWPAEPDTDVGDDPHPPGTWMGHYARESGTVGDVLQGIEEANPALSWEVVNSRVIMRREPQSERLDRVFTTRIGKLNMQEIPDPFVSNIMGRAQDQVLVRLPKAEMRALRPDWRIEYPAEAHRFVGRVEMSVNRWQEDENQTFADVFRHLTPASGTGFWYAIDAESGEAAGVDLGSDTLRTAVTNWSPVRGQLSIEELMEGLYQVDEPNYGYRTKRIRIEDMQRELKRRHHFHPEAVRSALVDDGHLANLLEGQDIPAQDSVRWMTSLGDAVLNDFVFEEARQLVNPDKTMHPLVAFPRPDHQYYDASLLPRWREVAESFPVERVRRHAKYIVALHEWIENGGADSGRPRPRY